ncbi:syntaxin-23-like [Lathyrus oleraceus]|uniref:syntaxin-23-like n=1 Tax=Pisum sativum TaxID=3888 RepID=UPI0021D2CC33|nr:syntaxin-23-like [Pisum sativum]
MFFTSYLSANILNSYFFCDNISTNSPEEVFDALKNQTVDLVITEERGIALNKVTPELREKLHKTRLHIGQLVKDTSDKLKQASEIDHHVDVNWFLDTQPVFSASVLVEMMEPEGSSTISVMSGEGESLSAQLAHEVMAIQADLLKNEISDPSLLSSSLSQSSSSELEKDSKVSEREYMATPVFRALLVESKRQDVISLDNEISFNEAIIEEREQGIQEVQQQIGEVNEIFKDLAVLVHEQGEMIDDIGSNIEHSHEATAQAKSELVKASKTQ